MAYERSFMEKLTYNNLLIRRNPREVHDAQKEDLRTFYSVHFFSVASAPRKSDWSETIKQASRTPALLSRP